MLLLLLLLLALMLHHGAHGDEEHRKLVASVESVNLPLGCAWNGHPMCCGLVNESFITPNYPRSRVLPVQTVDHHCVLHKQYVPSPYEAKHMAKAQEWLSLSYEDSRTALREYIVEDIPHSLKWLARVKEHMYAGSAAAAAGTEDDLLYLSYFQISRMCGDKITQTWTEWIEPLTVHARHPFAMMDCPGQDYLQKHRSAVTPVNIQNVDYVLLKSAAHLQNIRLNNHHTSVLPKHYFFDAGTATFETGLMWFICSYLQKHIVFDDIYGWEYTGMDPKNFWQQVPSRILPFYHFYNDAVSADNSSALSITRVIKELAREHDFVSFKLDIDTPDVELPIAQELLADPALHGLVDEFFFELHFRCEVMMDCGWTHNIPDESHGMKLQSIMRSSSSRICGGKGCARIFGHSCHHWQLAVAS